MYRVIVWGASGFLGKNLVKALKENYYVYAIVKKNSRIPHEWNQYKNLTILTQEDVQSIEKADIMFFLAWSGTSGEERKNIELQFASIKVACEAVQIAARLRCFKFVYAGSIMEYEAIEYLGKKDMIPNKNYVYSISKLLADYYVKILANDLKIEYCNALISNIYGPGEKSKRFIITMCDRLLKNQKIELTSGMQLYDFIYIDDAMSALKLIGEKGKNNEIYYIGNKTQKTLKEYILSMQKVIGSSAELVFGAIDFSGISLTYQEFNTSALYDDLGFQCMVDFEDGIQKTIEWLKREEEDDDGFTA